MRKFDDNVFILILSKILKGLEGINMKIKDFISQNRRDFVAIFICEHCKNEVEKNGYDDNFFHETVIPDMVCNVCGKKAPENYRPLQPKYHYSVTI